MVETREIAHVNVVLWTVANFVAIHVEIVFAIDCNAARCLRNNATDHRHGGCLAGSIVAQQNGNLILQNVNRQIIDGIVLLAPEFLEHFGESTNFHGNVSRILHIDDCIGVLIAATRIDPAATSVAIVRWQKYEIEWFWRSTFARKHVRQIEIQ